VIAVRVLNDKSTYNQIELPSGRMAQVKRATSSPARSASPRAVRLLRAPARAARAGDVVQLLTWAE